MGQVVDRRVIFNGSLILNSLRPSDAIWQHLSESTLVQVMAWCLTAPIHYLNQCWLIIKGVLWYSPYNIFTGSARDISSWYEFENYNFEIMATSPRGQWDQADPVWWKCGWEFEFMLTLNVRGPSYLDLTMSISWLLMPWLLTSPGHQQPWYWLGKIQQSRSYTRTDFNYLWHISVEE